MTERRLRVLNAGGNQEFERHLGPYEKVAVVIEGDDVLCVCSNLVTEQEVNEGVVPQAVLDMVPAPQFVERQVAVGSVETFAGAEGRHRYRFRVLASNGEIIAASEGYVRRKDRDATAAKFAEVFGADLNQLPAPE